MSASHHVIPVSSAGSSAACVPAQFQPRALIRVPRLSGVAVVVLVGLACRARRTRLSLQSERLSPVVCNTGSVSALHLGGALGQSAPCSPEKWTHSFSADEEKAHNLAKAAGSATFQV